jgi:hypothetical protein
MALASNAHVSVIGHITQADLDGLLDTTDVFNGFGNRFLWAMAKRSKALPFGGDLRVDDPAVRPLVRRAQDAILWADAKERHIELSTAARRIWPKLYEELGRSEEGGSVRSLTVPSRRSDGLRSSTRCWISRPS